MRKLGTIDLEILDLAMQHKERFDERHLENSELKRLGVGRILDALASLKERKLISLNRDEGYFSITELAREILWSDKVPVWGKILRLLHIKSCSLNQIVETLRISEDVVFENIENLRKNQLILMSPQRQDDKVVKIYEILPEGIERIDITEIEGFTEKLDSKRQDKENVEILELIDKINYEVKELKIESSKKDEIIKQMQELKQKLQI